MSEKPETSADRPPARPRWPRLLLWALLVLVLASVTMMAIVTRLQRQTELPPVLGQAPAFELTNQRGETYGRQELAGLAWVADFIFTRCALSCPAMSARMAVLDRALPPEVALVSFTVDPAHDTPEVLAAYAGSFGASERWRFLTGDPDEMLSLVREGFRLAVDPSPPPGVAPEGEPIIHSTRFVLVDSRGRIRGYYDLLERDGVDRLTRDVGALVR